MALTFEEFYNYKNKLIEDIKSPQSLSDLEESKNWIAKAIKHPGRCTPMGTAKCPKGSPQYNLAQTLKSFHKSKKKKK